MKIANNWLVNSLKKNMEGKSMRKPKFISEIGRRVIGATGFGEIKIDGKLMDPILKARVSNFILASLYHISRYSSKKTLKYLEPRMNLFKDSVQDIHIEVLKRLISEVSEPNMAALEIGSWLGKSTEQLGKIVKENNGRLFCVDIWGKNESNIIAEYDIRAKRRINLFNIMDMFLEKIGVPPFYVPVIS